MALDDLKYYVIGIIFFVVVITGGVLFIGSFNAYDPTIDSTNQIGYFNNTLDKSTEVTAAVGEIENSIADVESNTGLLGWLNALIGSAYNGLRAIGSSFGFIEVAASDSANMLSIPPSMVALILLVIIVIVVFAVWSVITRTY